MSGEGHRRSSVRHPYDVDRYHGEAVRPCPNIAVRSYKCSDGGRDGAITSDDSLFLSYSTIYGLLLLHSESDLSNRLAHATHFAYPTTVSVGALVCCVCSLET